MDFTGNFHPLLRANSEKITDAAIPTLSDSTPWTEELNLGIISFLVINGRIKLFPFKVSFPKLLLDFEAAS